MIRKMSLKKIIALSLLVVATLMPSAIWAEEPWQAPFHDVKLLFCFQGKGASLAFDGGVLREARERIPALRQNQVILAGNSSGAILATYFSCFGFSDESLAYCDYQLMHGDREVIRKMQDVNSLTIKTLLGKRTELDHIQMMPYIAFALGVENSKSIRSFAELARRSRAKPQRPLLIVAGNREVLENRGEGDLLAAKNYKVFDPRDCSVSWHPEVHDYFRRHPDRFAAEYPNLKLGETPYIGKAVTFFVDRSMYDLLRQIPAAERTGDLRLVETPEDLILAILASVAEPSFFDPAVETSPEKLLCADEPGDLVGTRHRSYCGGVYMMMPAQDVRRMLPGIRVFGSGWSLNPYAPRELVKSWYLADLELLARLNGWWADVELQPTPEVKKQLIVTKKIGVEAEYNLGVETARAGFAEDNHLPAYVTEATYPDAAAKAYLPAGEQPDMFEKSPDGKRRLKTMRGLGPLLKKPGQ